MDHVAILKKAKVSKKDNLLADILAGTKTIESRWYLNKISPWNKITKGDTVYFKESGCPVTAAAEVLKVIQYSDLDPKTISLILNNYGKEIAPNASDAQIKTWAKSLVAKNYCILIFLKNARKINSFKINKKGFGISSAWLVVGDIKKVKT